MRKFHATARWLAMVADHAVGWLLLITVILNVAQVFTRYVLNDPLFWTEEMIRYATIWLTFVGAAAASQYGDHMDMNLFLDVQNARFQLFHQIFLNAIALVFAVLIIWQGFRYTTLNGMQTAPATGIPMYFTYSAPVIGGILLVFISIHKILAAAWPRYAGSDAA